MELDADDDDEENDKKNEIKIFQDLLSTSQLSEIECRFKFCIPPAGGVFCVAEQRLE
jgi:hypothetical protein